MCAWDVCNTVMSGPSQSSEPLILFQNTTEPIPVTSGTRTCSPPSLTSKPDPQPQQPPQTTQRHDSTRDLVQAQRSPARATQQDEHAPQRRDRSGRGSPLGVAGPQSLLDQRGVARESPPRCSYRGDLRESTTRQRVISPARWLCAASVHVAERAGVKRLSGALPGHTVGSTWSERQRSRVE